MLLQSFNFFQTYQYLLIWKDMFISIEVINFDHFCNYRISYRTNLHNNQIYFIALGCYIM
jgi:hypothetical protein